jgi:hypothetical protein
MTVVTLQHALGIEEGECVLTARESRKYKPSNDFGA